MKRSTTQPASPNSRSSLAGCGIHGQPVRVVGVPLGRPGPPGCCGPSRPRSPGAASGSSPRPATSTTGAHQVKPASTTAEASPTTRPTRPLAMKSTLRYIGGPVMPAVELPRRGQVVGEVRVLEVADAGRVDAAVDQPLVEPGRQLVAEIHADRGLQRIDHQHQRRSTTPVSSERTDQRASPRSTAPTMSPVATANTAGRSPLAAAAAHQATASRGVGLRQGGEELPLLPRPQPPPPCSALCHQPLTSSCAEPRRRKLGRTRRAAARRIVRSSATALEKGLHLVMRTHGAGTLRAEHAGTTRHPRRLGRPPARPRRGGVRGSAGRLRRRPGGGPRRDAGRVRRARPAQRVLRHGHRRGRAAAGGQRQPRPAHRRDRGGHRELEVLSPSAPLPFQIDERVSVGEEARLKYRYLDLRRPGPGGGDPAAQRGQPGRPHAAGRARTSSRSRPRP